VNTKTKMIKRQMIGRAGFTLLRHRSCPASNRPLPLSRPGARCRDCSRSVSPDLSPNPPCASRRNGLSTVFAVRCGCEGRRDWGSGCRGSDTG
jgi:predicted amidophosphoribosyltransferase